MAFVVVIEKILIAMITHTIFISVLEEFMNDDPNFIDVMIPLLSRLALRYVSK